MQDGDLHGVGKSWFCWIGEEVVAVVVDPMGVVLLEIVGAMVEIEKLIQERRGGGREG
jgi:hypothetical protein